MTDPALDTDLPPEAVHLVRDEDTGLDGVIVVHSTRLGPAAGGCRLWRYPARSDALRDAVRLAKGMAFKNAMADLPLGGGKAVMMMPDGGWDRRRAFQAFGRAVDKLAGAYVTAEDVGTTVDDMRVVREVTAHVAGLEKQPGRPGGDPSPWTALGVFLSMKEAARRKFGSDLSGMRVVVQGLGNVGSRLCALLHDAGAKLTVADLHAEAVDRVVRLYGAQAVASSAILECECEIFAPCALGGVIDCDSSYRLQAKIICGGANNVLATPQDGDRLADRGVLFAPDYVVNAGGIINVAGEYLGWTEAEVDWRVRSTGDRLADVLDHAEQAGLSPHRAADALARRRIALGQPGALVASAG